MPETTQFTGANEGSVPGSDTALKASSVLHNRFKIMGVIGGGGMGTVYKARDLNFTDVQKPVAIKEMQTFTVDPAMRSSMLKTFRREANILATLSHPAIPKIFDFFDLNDRAYLVMEFINGSDLELLMNKTKELPTDKIIEWAIDLCDVLDYLHNQKPDPIIFRDVKPSNIMIDNLGRVRLIDFGIAKAFVTGVKGTMIGTEGYSGPEQYRGEATPQSDIYSLGATLHHLLTRKDPRLEPPFSFHERPIPNYNTKAPEALIAIVEKALTFNTADRYQSCAEMKGALEQLRYRSLPVPVAPASNGGSAPPPAYARVSPDSAVSSPTMPAPVGTGYIEESNLNAGAVQPKWVFKTEDEIRCGPVATRDLALVGSYDSNVWAVKLDTGELVWKFATHGGIASSPVVDENARTVVFGSEDKSLYAVDYRTGRISWSYATKDRIRSTPRVAHDHVFFGSDDGKIYALGMVNGRFLWGYDMASPVRSRPFVTNELVIAGSETGEIAAVSLSGQRKWTYRAKRGVMSGPIVDAEGICYIGSTDAYMYALDVGNGFNVWRFRTNGPIVGSAAEGRGLVYFGSVDGVFYCLNAQNGREKWRFTLEKPIVSSPLVHKNAVYFGGTDDTFYCLEADTGKERWKYKMKGAITSAPYAVGEILLVGSMDHNLYAFPLVG